MEAQQKYSKILNIRRNKSQDLNSSCITELILGIFQNGPTPPPNLKSGPELPHPISKVGQKVLKEKSHNR